MFLHGKLGIVNILCKYGIHEYILTLLHILQTKNRKPLSKY